jgi:microcystin-dependent protein
MEGFIGEVKYFAGTYAPSGWMFCEGQQLVINQYTPLYSLIGTQFGGDGKTYFNLPDLRGRMTCGSGQSDGTSYRHPGETGGNEGVVLTQLAMPLHNHTVKCDTTTGGRSIKTTPQDDLYATIVSAGYGTDTTGTPLMKNDLVNNAGQNAAHENMSPWLCLHYIICVYGYYPIRP